MQKVRKLFITQLKTGKYQKTHLVQQKTSINKKLYKIFPVCRILPKTLRSHYFWFLVQIEGGLRLKQLRKKSHTSEKRRSQN